MGSVWSFLNSVCLRCSDWVLAVHGFGVEQFIEQHRKDECCYRSADAKVNSFGRCTCRCISGCPFRIPKMKACSALSHEAAEALGILWWFVHVTSFEHFAFRRKALNYRDQSPRIWTVFCLALKQKCNSVLQSKRTGQPLWFPCVSDAFWQGWGCHMGLCGRGRACHKWKGAVGSECCEETSVPALSSASGNALQRSSLSSILLVWQLQELGLVHIPARGNCGGCSCLFWLHQCLCLCWLNTCAFVMAIAIRVCLLGKAESRLGQKFHAVWSSAGCRAALSATEKGLNVATSHHLAVFWLITFKNEGLFTWAAGSSRSYFSFVEKSCCTWQLAFFFSWLQDQQEP